MNTGRIAEQQVMKILKPFVGVGVLALPLAVQGADGSHSYFTFDTGVALRQDVKVKEALGMSVSGGRIGFDPGVRFDVSGGYSFNDSLSLGIETGMLYNNIRKLSSAGVSLPPSAVFGADVGFFQVPILANVILTPPLRSPVRPFVGAGAGGVASIIEGSTINTESDFTFAYEG